MCVYGVIVVRVWWGQQSSCCWIWIISSALHSRWQDHWCWSYWYSSTLCFISLLLLWSWLCLSYPWNLLSIEVVGAVLLVMHWYGTQ